MKKYLTEDQWQANRLKVKRKQIMWNCVIAIPVVIITLASAYAMFLGWHH